nr:hypothetical protein [Tanacetum cinerariifolium]
TTSLEKIAAQKAEIATLNAKTVGNKTRGNTKPANPKVIAPGLYAISPKKLPAKSAKREKVEEHIRNLNKNNRVDSHVKRSVCVKNLNAVCGACHACLISSNHDNFLVYSVKSVNRKQPKAKNTMRTTKKVWRPKVVTSVKPMWKPSGWHFTLYDSYPLTRILEPTVEPIELSLSVSSSTKILMLSKFVAVTLGMESWFQRNPCYAKPTYRHLQAIKRIFRYLKGTIHMDTMRSTSGSSQFLGGRLVSWSSKKQKSTAISTTEAEYTALSGSYAQIL